MIINAERNAQCETCNSRFSYYHAPGEDYTCPNCDQRYNAFGQRVTCSLDQIDPLYAGEVWEDEPC